MQGGTKKAWFDSRGFRTFYVVLLITLIPAVIIFNTVLIVNEFEERLTVEVQRKALLATNVINASSEVDVTQQESVQMMIERVSLAGEEFVAIDVFEPTPNGFRVVASLDSSRVGQEIAGTQLAIAWQSADAIAYKTADSSVRTFEETVDSGPQRYWVITQALTNGNDRVGLISVKFSSEFIDSLVAKTLQKSYVLLALTILLVIGVLAAIWQVIKRERAWKRRAGMLDAEKMKFITVATHILRTPINTLRWNFEMLLAGDFGRITKQQKSVIHDMHEKNQLLIHAVDDLIVGLNAAQKTLDVKKKQVQVKNIVDSIVLDMKARVEAKEITLASAVPSRLKRINADPNLLHQALYKLVDNAFKYSQKGGEIDISARATHAGLELTVADNGIGIPEDEQESIFEAFTRGRRAMKTVTDAPGLGLFVAREIISKHGGTIEFESEEGKGSTFTIRLPWG